MDRYTIYCSMSQTKKALELGAPILVIPELYQENIPHFHMCINNENAAVLLPTAEQMIEWLESNDLLICVKRDLLGHWHGSVETNDHYYTTIDFQSRKEATLSAVDKALECIELNL